MSGTTQKLDSVQALRGIAAMSVFVYHMKFQFPLWSEDATNFVARIAMKGYFGVDIFFVISGFILAWVGVLSRPDQRAESPTAFAIKRFFRIAPAFWASLAVIAYLLGRTTTGANLFRMVTFYPIGDMPAPHYSAILNDVGWTLNYEVAFYLTFCCALFLGHYALIAVAAIILGLVFIAPLAYGYLPTIDPILSVTPFSTLYLRMVTNPLMLEFLMGIAAAWAYARFRDNVSPTFAFSLMVLGGSTMLLIYSVTDDVFSLLGIAFPAALLMLGAAFAEHRGLLRIPRFAVWLGDVSFALYLTHWTLRYLVLQHFPKPVGIAGAYGEFLVLTAIALVIAHFWKRFIEDPTAAWGHAIAKVLIPQRAERAAVNTAPGAPASIKA